MSNAESLSPLPGLPHSNLAFSSLAGGGEAVAYLLLAHKSYADRLAVFQLLK